MGTMGGELKPMDYESESDEEVVDIAENGLESHNYSSRCCRLQCLCFTFVKLLLFAVSYHSSMYP